MENPKKTVNTQWHHELNLIETNLSGNIDEQDVIQWEKSLHDALALIPEGSQFKILVNLYGFKAVNIQVHKRYRDIIPMLLADYNWKVGYVDLFEESRLMKFRKTRNIACAAAVHVHQDGEKINKYEANFSRENEHFMTDLKKAKEWILSYPID